MMNLEQKCRESLDLWLKRLGFTKNKILSLEICIDPKNEPDKSNVHFDFNEKKIYIHMKTTDNFLVVVHELGHPYIALKYNDPLFATKSLRKNQIETNIKLFIELLRVLDDIFVDYHLFKFPEYYNWHLQEKYKAIPPDSETVSIEYSTDFLTNLMCYIYENLSIRHILKQYDRQIRKTRIETHILKTKQLLLSSAQKESLPFTAKNLRQIDTALIQFGKVKDTRYVNSIYKFFKNVFKAVGLWKDNKIDDIFNKIKNQEI